MKGKALVRLLQEHGWSVGRVVGSHHVMVQPGRRPIPVPVHGSRDLPHALVEKILKEAGLR